MNLLDLISVLDANDVTPSEFQETWGISKDEYLNDMKSFIAEQRTKNAAK